MGVIWSYVWGNNDPDPVTGLTPRERYLVTSSFNVIKTDMVGAGIELFMMLFERKPEYQNFFPFKDIPRKELPSSGKFKAHAVTVMYAISSIIENLENSDVLVHLLQKTATSHAKRNIPPESFRIVQDIVLELVKKTLGSSISEEGVDAWDKTLNVAFKVIEDTLNDSNSI